MKHFPKTYDSKSIAVETGLFSLPKLEAVFGKCVKNKSLSSNLNFSLEKDNPMYSTYHTEGKLHDAAFDAYMTAYSFALCVK